MKSMKIFKDTSEHIFKTGIGHYYLSTHTFSLVWFGYLVVEGTKFYFY